MYNKIILSLFFFVVIIIYKTSQEILYVNTIFFNTN